jgi:nitric oxide reductase large subunit
MFRKLDWHVLGGAQKPAMVTSAVIGPIITTWVGYVRSRKQENVRILGHAGRGGGFLWIVGNVRYLSGAIFLVQRISRLYAALIQPQKTKHHCLRYAIDSSMVNQSNNHDRRPE